MMEWQWHQLDHMQVICTRSRQITMPAAHHSDFYKPDALPAIRPTASKHWRHTTKSTNYLWCETILWWMPDWSSSHLTDALNTSSMSRYNQTPNFSLTKTAIFTQILQLHLIYTSAMRLSCLIPVSHQLVSKLLAVASQSWHISRLGEEVPAHQAHCAHIDLSLPGRDWKRRPGRPNNRWVNQVRNDTGNMPSHATAQEWRNGPRWLRANMMMMMMMCVHSIQMRRIATHVVAWSVCLCVRRSVCT